MKTVQFRFKVFLLIVLMGGTLVFSQREAQYTQYMYNTSMVNPGYAGTDDALKISLLHRSQWVGIDGAPTTQTFSIEDNIYNDCLLYTSDAADE